MKKIVLVLSALLFITSICQAEPLTSSGYFCLGAIYNSNGVETMALDFENESKSNKIGVNFRFGLDKEQTKDIMHTFDTVADLEAKYYYNSALYGYLGFGYDDIYNTQYSIRRTRTGIGAGYKGYIEDLETRWNLQDGFYLSTAYALPYYDRNLANILRGEFEQPLYENLSWNARGWLEVNMERLDDEDYRFHIEPSFSIALAENVSADIGLEYDHVHRPLAGEERDRRKWGVKVGAYW